MFNHGSSKERTRMISTGSTGGFNANNQSLSQNQSINNISAKNLLNSPGSSTQNTKYQANSMKNVSGMNLNSNTSINVSPNISNTQQQ